VGEIHTTNQTEEEEKTISLHTILFKHVPYINKNILLLANCQAKIEANCEKLFA
jgi:hypothetical protein